MNSCDIQNNKPNRLRSLFHRKELILALWGIFFFVFLTAAVYVGSDIFQPIDPWPELIAEPTGLDFGKVSPGTLYGKIKLQNPSKVPIQILSAMKSCACTDIVIPQEEIPPGGWKEIEVTFETGVRPGLSGGNIVVAYVPVCENARQAQYLTIPVSAEVIDEDTLEPIDLPPLRKNDIHQDQ